MTSPQLWCRVTALRPDGSRSASFALEGSGQPDLTAVDEVARLLLHARRLGGTVVLEDVSPRISELLELAGLVVEIR
jgi:hypothetical protein